MSKYSLSYLATPYTHYLDGHHAAFIAAANLAGRLIPAGINCYSPIVHSHPICVHGGLDALNQELWLNLDNAMLHACDALIVAHMDGWEKSTGIAYEIEFFESRAKPIFDLNPTTLTMARRK